MNKQKLIDSLDYRLRRILDDTAICEDLTVGYLAKELGRASELYNLIKKLRGEDE